MINPTFRAPLMSRQNDRCFAPWSFLGGAVTADVLAIMLIATIIFTVSPRPSNNEN